MSGTRLFVRVLTAICIFGLLPSGVAAQALPGRVAGASPGQSPLSVGAAGSFSGTSDLLFGKGNAGPYALSWKPVSQFSERVTVDDVFVQRDLDYGINYGAGTITLKSPVKADSVIRVEYSYDPANATRNASPLTIPLRLDLLKKDDVGLQFTGLYKGGDPNAKTPTDLSIYGLTGNTKGSAGEFSSMFLFSPDKPNGTDDSSFGDRSAVSLGGSTKTDKMKLSASYARTGEKFAGAKDYKVQQGSEMMDLAATFAPSSALSVSSSLKRTENLMGDKAGEATSTTSHSVAFAPTGAPKLTASRTEVEKEKPGTDTQKTTTDKVQITHALNPNVSAAASHEDVATEAGSSGSRVSTDQISLTAKAAGNLSLAGSFIEKDSSKDGKETGIGLSINAAPMKTLSMKAAINRTDTDKAGETNSESLKLVANPSKLLSIVMDLARRDADATGDEFKHAISVMSSPISSLKLELGMSGQNMERPGDMSSRMAKISSTALKNTTVQLNWSDTESELKGPEEVSGVRVESTPSKIIKLSGGLGQKETADSREIRTEAALEVSPFSHTKVSGAYREVETDGALTSRVTELSAATKPIRFLELTGGYKLRETMGQQDLDSLNVALLLDTGALFKLTGNYVTNPENKEGVVQRANSQTIGIKSDLGRLKVKGSLTTKDEYLVGKSNQTTEVTLDYRLSAHSLLTTGYSLAENKDGSVLETSVYTLGYSHAIASRLNIYLGGKMTTFERDQMALRDQTQLQAEARIGIKF